MTRRLLLIAITLFVPLPSFAQMIDVTPEVFARVRGLAAAAREQHPTSPNEAVQAFIIAFNGAFGNTMPADAYLADTPALNVTLWTPINDTRGLMEMALSKLQPLPEQPLSDQQSVRIHVIPKQMSAPNIERLVLFRGTQQIEPLKNLLEPTEFTNRLGAKTMLGEGSVVYPFSAFRPGEPVKCVAFTRTGSLEWPITVTSLK